MYSLSGTKERPNKVLLNHRLRQHENLKHSAVELCSKLHIELDE